MYSLSQLRRGIGAPNLVLREVNRLYYRRFYTRPCNTAGIDVFEADWDNLVILDACRYDMFAEQTLLPGRLQSRISRGSSTAEFLAGNFAGRDLRDTVYVTANPQLYRRRAELEVALHATVEVWQDGWDEIRKTVMPTTMVEATLDAATEFPNKRVVSHFIQPHYPFLDDAVDFDHGDEFLDPTVSSCWHQVMVGDLSVDTDAVWEAYRGTLERTLPAVARLVDELPGRTVVTADHGNMVGERARPIPVREWGHPAGIYTDELVKVPWLIVEGERRAIKAESGDHRNEDRSTATAEQRLQDLGYVA